MNIDLKNNEYEIIDINPICYKCFHTVKIKTVSSGEINSQIVTGIQIAEYFKYKNINIPQHFVEYITSKN